MFMSFSFYLCCFSVSVCLSVSAVVVGVINSVGLMIRLVLDLNLDFFTY